MLRGTVDGLAVRGSIGWVIWVISRTPSSPSVTVKAHGSRFTRRGSSKLRSACGKEERKSKQKYAVLATISDDSQQPYAILQ